MVASINIYIQILVINQEQLLFVAPKIRWGMDDIAWALQKKREIHEFLTMNAPLPTESNNRWECVERSIAAPEFSTWVTNIPFANPRSRKLTETEK
jgi:hypothetical protein